MKQTYQINVAAVIGCAIATAQNQLGICPDTDIEEVFSEFNEIRQYAIANLTWMGIEDQTISDYEIANALFGYDEDDYIDFMMKLDEENEIA